MVNQQIALTDQTAAVVKRELSQINGSFSAQTQQEAAAALTALQNLRQLRKAATLTQLPALVVVDKYATIIQELIALIDVTGQGASDATLGQSIRVLEPGVPDEGRGVRAARRSSPMAWRSAASARTS